MSSGPHQMNIGWREVRTSRTVTRRLCGHVSGEPSDVFDQSNPLVKAPISPPPAKKSLTNSPPIRATSLKRSSPSLWPGSRKTQCRMRIRRCVKEQLVVQPLARNIHDGQEHIRAVQGPDTGAKDPPSICSHSACTARPVHTVGSEDLSAS